MTDNLDEFGFLPHKVKIFVGEYVIQPSCSYDAAAEEAKSRIDEDGYIFPQHPNKFGPTNFHKLPMSHTIGMASGLALPSDFRKKDGAFFIALLSLVFETRLQFKDWWHESRVYVRPSEVCLIRNGESLELFGQIINTDDELSELFQQCYARWSQLKSESKEAVLNALFFHTKAPSYLWGYEKFFADYVAIDAIWKAGIVDGFWTEDLRRRNKKKRRKISRLSVMIIFLEMYTKAHYFGGGNFSYSYCKELLKQVQQMDKVRNNLFHEGKWGENRISVTFNNLIALKIHRFLQRLILAYLGVKNNYVESTWWPSGHVLWKKTNSP